MPPSSVRGWELASMLVSPLLTTPAEQVPHLGEGPGQSAHSELPAARRVSKPDTRRLCRTAGELLGSGSTGRCFRARWCGADVAVKVFDHDADLVLGIERQVQQVLGIEHPNVVRVHACAIYLHNTRSGRGAAPASDACSLDILPLDLLAARTASGGGHHGLMLAGRQASISAGGRVAGSGISFSADSSSLLAPRAFSNRSLDVHTSSASFGGDSSHALPSRGMSSYSLGSQSALTAATLHSGAAAQAAAAEATGVAAAAAARTPEHASRPEDSAALLVTAQQHSLAKSLHDTHGCGSSSQSLPFVGGGSRCSGAACRAETWLIMQLAGTTTAAAVAAAWRQQPEPEQHMLARLLLLQDVAAGLKELHRLNLVHGELVRGSARAAVAGAPCMVLCSQQLCRQAPNHTGAARPHPCRAARAAAADGEKRACEQPAWRSGGGPARPACGAAERPRGRAAGQAAARAPRAFGQRAVPPGARGAALWPAVGRRRHLLVRHPHVAAVCGARGVPQAQPWAADGGGGAA